MSKAQITHDVVATIGTYKDRQTGEDKKRYVNVGKCFTSDDGRQSIKLDTIPVGPEWSGWISLFPIQDKPQSRSTPPQSAHNQAKSNGYQPDSDEPPF